MSDRCPLGYLFRAATNFIFVGFLISSIPICIHMFWKSQNFVNYPNIAKNFVLTNNTEFIETYVKLTVLFCMCLTN